MSNFPSLIVQVQKHDWQITQRAIPQKSEAGRQPGKQKGEQAGKQTGGQAGRQAVGSLDISSFLPLRTTRYSQSPLFLWVSRSKGCRFFVHLFISSPVALRFLWLPHVCRRPPPLPPYGRPKLAFSRSRRFQGGGAGDGGEMLPGGVRVHLTKR